MARAPQKTRPLTVPSDQSNRSSPPRPLLIGAPPSPSPSGGGFSLLPSTPNRPLTLSNASIFYQLCFDPPRRWCRAAQVAFNGSSTAIDNWIFSFLNYRGSNPNHPPPSLPPPPPPPPGLLINKEADIGLTTITIPSIKITPIQSEYQSIFNFLNFLSLYLSIDSGKVKTNQSAANPISDALMIPMWNWSIRSAPIEWQHHTTHALIFHRQAEPRSPSMGQTGPEMALPSAPPWETTPNPNTFAYRRPLAVDSLMSPPAPDSPAGGARPWRPATRQIDLICLRLHEEGNIFRWATLPFFSATVHFIPRGFVNRPSSAWLNISIWNRNFLTKKPIRIPNHFFLSLSLSWYPILLSVCDPSGCWKSSLLGDTIGLKEATT